ncbi:MAG: CapA family protein [Deltaproteobacteria bacterium]|nr:CapA family protein [Deltaproteobacteria bacterium]
MRARDIILLFGLLFLAFAAVYMTSGPVAESDLVPGPATVREEPPGGIHHEPGNAVSILFLGDFHPASLVKGASDPYQAFRPILGVSDLVIINLEAPTIDPGKWAAGTKTSRRFWSDVTATPALLKGLGVTVVSLASDHMLDFGTRGLESTIDALGKAGLEVIGAGHDKLAASKPYRFESTVGGKPFKMAVIATADQWRGTRVFPLSEAQVRTFNTAAIVDQIHGLKQREPDLFVVVFIHWGWQYSWLVKRQRDEAHAMIDAGADLIVGHGAHAPQQVEIYKDRLCLYGIGDFVSGTGKPDKHLGNDLPFGLLADLVLEPDGTGISRFVKLYPVRNYGLGSGEAPRFVTVKELGNIYWKLVWRSWKIYRYLKNKFVVRTDRFGRYLEIPLTDKARGASNSAPRAKRKNVR